MTIRLNIMFKIFALAALVQFECFAAPSDIDLPAPDTTLLTTPRVPLKPGPNDGRIAYVTARLLEEYHYSQQPLDEETSKKFFDGYLEELDPQRLHFLQSDIAQFAHYRTNLDTLTVSSLETADLTPAYEIYQRFLERLQQRVVYVGDLLKQDKFQFDGHEQILIDRHDATYPKDLDEAKQLWREHLSWDYLQEKLSREISPTNDSITLILPKSAATNITDTLRRRYERGLRSFTERDSSDILQIYLEALAHSYDPHSDYFNTEHAQDFSIGMSLSLFGIGAELHSDDGYCTIGSLISGGPAAKSKQLKANDKIVAVAQSNQPPVDVVDMELSKVVQMIRGPKGTQVRLTIVPAEAPNTRQVVSLVRDEIKLADQEAKAQLVVLPNGKGGTSRIGVIDVPSFYAPVDLSGGAASSTNFVSTDVAKLIKKLKQEKVAGIIIDLRNNGGGSLEEAVKFTGLFIKGGLVVLVRTPDGRVIADNDDDPSLLYNGPLIVLANRLSASASEIVAAALQDYGRALIVGDTSTFGKGTVQNLDPLRPFIESATNDPGTLKITIRKFYRVSGASTQFKGVASDIVLPDKLNYATDIGEASLDNPLTWDTIPSAEYDKLNLTQPYLAGLRALSGARIATNQDFIYIRQDIDEFKKLEADKTASLNERDELKEHQETETKGKARAQEREKQKTPDEKIYDLTVENAGQPGLPAPVQETNTITGAYQHDGTTNSAQAVSAKSANDGSNNIDENQQAEAARLSETEHILLDYISLLSSNQILIAN
jgi:carboxyl-terminal processing protease